MASFLDKLHVVTRAGACIAAGVPTTTLIPLPLTLAMTRRYRREESLKRLHCMVQWARFCRRHILKATLSVQGREHLPPSTRGHMFVSNHQSWIDILILMEALDTVSFLSKSLVKFIPVIGACAYAGGTVFFDRGIKDSRSLALQQTLRMCARSTAVVVFPEGTRSFDGELRQQIHPGAIKAAFGRELKVIPVALDGTCKILPKTMDSLCLGKPVAITIGPVLDPHGFTDEEAWVGEVWGRISELFAQSRARLQR